VPDLAGVDLNAWKNDSGACLNRRAQFVDTLRSQKDKLKGLSERDLVKMLGNPDLKDLSEHHEKYYTYFLEPGPGCNNADSSTLILEIQFNATGVSKGVNFIAYN
jgi:hypothetical protein